MPRRYLRLKGSACRSRRYAMGSCCTWPREDDGYSSSRDSQSIPDTDEPKLESEGRRVGAAEDISNFRMHDGITIGDPPWVVLPLPPTWPPFTAEYYERLWQQALPVTI